MLRDSHRALMHTDAALRSELKDLHQRYRADAKHWKKNFRDLQQYYQGLASAPPPDTANVNLWPPTHARHDDDEPEDGAIVEQRAKAAAWGERVTRHAEEAMSRIYNNSDVGWVPASAGTEGSALYGDRGVVEVGEPGMVVPSIGDHTTSNRRSGQAGSAKRASGRPSPARRGGTPQAGGTASTKFSASPAKRRSNAEIAEEEIREKLQWTQAMASAKKTIEKKN